MERKGPRGSKPKNVPPHNLFALGNKSSSSSTSVSRVPSNLPITSKDNQQSQLTLDKVTHNAGFGKSSSSGTDRGREASAGLISKKSAKPNSIHGSRGITRPCPPKVTTGDLLEGWENAAEIVETEDLIALLEAAEEREDYDKIQVYLCGAIKSIKSQRMKPDNILCITLMYLAKVRPSYFIPSKLAIDGLCCLLKKADHSLSFKAKSNASVPVLAANILLCVYQEVKEWPENFVRVFIEDSLGERLWVDHEDCKGFVDNLTTSFGTKISRKSILFPDLGLSSRQECPSPPVSICSGVESGDGDSELSLECKENLDIGGTNRYNLQATEIEALIIETVQNQLNLRHQNVDAVARNFIKFLSTVCGYQEVRKVIAPRLEAWLQNPKLQRPAIELLMSVCLNCNTHSQSDQKVISCIVHFRIKLKPLTNHYMTCLRELLSSHPDNIASVMKETTFNELSPTRNLANMQILAVVFQFAPEHAAVILAEIFLELLRNNEDFLRALRALLREIVRSLRHDMQYQKLCHALMKEQKDSHFKESFEFKERMFHSIVDLIVFTMFVSISPQVREGAAQIYKGDAKEVEIVRRYQETISNIQQDALYWMHRIAIKTYSPSKEEYAKSLHKLLMMDQAEFFYQKDNLPPEGDRHLFFRLASEVPVKQETLHRLLIIGTMKEQYLKPQEVLELADKLIKKATTIHSDTLAMLHIIDTKVIDLIFNLCPYIPPENSPLPPGYRPPKTAIANLYWKAWTMLLLITAHNPSVFGVLAWESYPILRVLMEMCITNCFGFPPPTMSIGEKGEEMSNQELILCSRERQQILEFESHLAQKTITEQNSLLLSQLITMDITGPARKPPAIVLDQLNALNSSHKIGHLLCRCRKPDFLVDIIQRQGALQSMPWLAQLVESNDDAFSVLPVQCLCEYLLSETVQTVEGAITTRHQQLLQHLRCLLLSPKQGEDCSVEILEYFLRRLSSQQPSARTQAVRGLQLVVGPLTESMEVEPDKQEPYKWLLKHLVVLPGFHMVRSGACQALRAACLIETKPDAVSAYIRFLSVHTIEDSLQEMAALVQDMAQLIVERSTMISAILPSSNHSGVHKFPHAFATLNSLFIIFINYMMGARLPPRDLMPWLEHPDHVRVQWASNEQALMHILVIHSMVILLISGPSASPELFSQLLNIWFPENQEMPQAFMLDSSQEALLLPDWLKLKMIRSTVPQLVDAALKDLEPSQLVLFIQSFGIPVASMTKLLCALDLAVNNSEESVAAAVLDKSHKNYMAQLVEVQHQRGARGGLAFAATLGERDDDLYSDCPSPFKPIITSLKVVGVTPMQLSANEVQSFILQCFTSSSLHIDHKKQVKDTMRTLQQHLSREVSNNSGEKEYLSELLRSLTAILQSPHAGSFVEGLHQHCSLSAPLFRLLLQMKERPECFNLYQMTVTQVVTVILHLKPNANSYLSPIFLSFASGRSSSAADFTANGTLEVHDHVTIVDIKSEQNVLKKLNNASASQLERVIRDLVQIAMKEGKIALIVNAIAHMLVSKLKSQKSTGLPGHHIALLLDWIQVLDPELHFIPPTLSKLLLFGKTDDSKQAIMPAIVASHSKVIEEKLPCIKTKGSYSQAYLLAAFTHQANWVTLEGAIHELLSNVDCDLDPTAILDFVWAVLNVPKLWQGRERRTPRHARPDLPLKFSTSELLNLAQYILIESKLNSVSKISTSSNQRLSLLFLCLSKSSLAMKNLVQNLFLLCNSKDDQLTSQVSNELLYHIFLRQPCIIRYLPKSVNRNFMQIQIKNNSLEQSAADVSLHTMLTMLTSPKPEKEFVRKMQDLEAALRKMASDHPILVVRHLPLLAATLQGLTHLNWSAFQQKNYPELFSMVFGILELLQPLIFYEIYSVSFCKTIDAYIMLFEEHGNFRELSQLLLRSCHLLMAWLGTRSSIAKTYITKHAALFSALMKNHVENLPLRSLAAIATSKGNDQSKSDKGSEEPISLNFEENLTSNIDNIPLPVYLLQQARDLQADLENFKTTEEQSDLLKRVKDLSDQSMGGVLSPFFHCLAEGLLSSEVKNRDSSWNLLILLLRKKPKMAPQISQAVLTALNSEEVSVAVTAVDHLPEVILMLHEYAPDLLTAGFNVCLFAEPTTTDMLSEALFLLTIHSGA